MKKENKTKKIKRSRFAYDDGFEDGVLEGKAQQKKEIIEMVKKRLGKYHYDLSRVNLPDMTQANLSGMIMSLEELKKQLETK